MLPTLRCSCFTAPLGLFAALLAGGPAFAQSLIVPDSTVRTVVALDAADGKMLAASLFDLDDGAVATNRPYQGIAVGHELWFTDDVTGKVTRWDRFGSTQLGAIDLAPHRLRGLTEAFGSIWVGAGTPSATVQDFLAQLTPAGALVALHPMPGLVNGVAALGGELLVANFDNAEILRVDPMSGQVLGVFHGSNGVTGIDGPGQITVEGARVFVAGGLAPVCVYEYDANGNEVAYWSTATLPQGGGARGVHPLANGDIALTAANSVYVQRTQTGAIDEIIDSLTPYFLSAVPIAPVGVLECTPAVPNTSGRPATLNAFGSALLAERSLRIVAQDLPVATVGMLVTSRTPGFVANPGGSQGNLCLGGAIGRYQNDIQFSANDGFFSFSIDPLALPQPNAIVAANAGETWRFQVWFRDNLPAPTSNFTNVTAVTFQ